MKRKCIKILPPISFDGESASISQFDDGLWMVSYSCGVDPRMSFHNQEHAPTGTALAVLIRRINED